MQLMWRWCLFYSNTLNENIISDLETLKPHDSACLLQKNSKYSRIHCAFPVEFIFSIMCPCQCLLNIHKYLIYPEKNRNDVGTSNLVSHSCPKNRTSEGSPVSLPQKGFWACFLHASPFPVLQWHLFALSIPVTFLTLDTGQHSLALLALPQRAAQLRQGQRKICQGLEELRRPWLPEPRWWQLNGSSVPTVHDTTVGTPLSAGKGHHEPRGYALERRQVERPETQKWTGI